MKPTDELHALIRAMSMHEKRHFRLLSSRHEKTGGNSYTQLFNRIAAQENYEEEKLKHGLDKAGRLRFATNKKYLHDQVIDSLNYYYRNQESMRMFLWLNTVEILYTKKLFNACLRLIRKGKNEALKYEKLYPALSFLRWEAAVLNLENRQDEIRRIMLDERNVLQRASVQAEIMQHAFRLRQWRDEGKITRKKQDTLIRSMHKIMSSASRHDEVTFLAHYYYHSALAFASSADQSKSRSHYLLIHNRLHEQPWFIKDLPHIYHHNINYIVSCCVALGEYEDALRWIGLQRNFMQQHKMRNEALAARIFLNTYENELIVYTQQKKFRQGQEFAKAIESGMRKFGSHYEGGQFDLFLSLAVFLFSGGELQNAVKWLLRIVRVKTQIPLRPEVTITARLLLLIALTEKKDPQFTAQYKSAQRWFSKHETFKTPALVMRFLKILHERKTGKTIKQKELHQIRQRLARLKDDPNEKLLLRHFDFGKWMAPER